MVCLGIWVNGQIQAGVLRTSATAGSLYVDMYLEPFIQNLAETGSISEADIAGLDNLLERGVPDQRVVAIKIWLADGTLAYSSDKELIGQTFEVPEVARAMTGETTAEFNRFDNSEPRQDSGASLIEIYAPLHRAGSTDIVAVGEFYERADYLERELIRSRIATWVVVGATTLLTLLVLFLIVRNGGSTIDRQRRELNDKVAEATTMARQNAQLRIDADRARLDASQANEQLLSRLGGELHDGPVQLLTLLMLKLSELPEREAAHAEGHNGEELTRITQVVLTELRNISAGLVLPELEDATLEGALLLAVRRHEDLTGTSVVYSFENLPENTSHALKTCIYRVVQEGLSNSFRHANGAHQHVEVTAAAELLTVLVWDEGTGLQNRDASNEKRAKLGLLAMRNRVTALHGSLLIDASPGMGLQLRAFLPLPNLED